jgi:hypothetical protein
LAWSGVAKATDKHPRGSWERPHRAGRSWFITAPGRGRESLALAKGTIMKLGICIAILSLALAGGVASAITAELLPAHADPCGGYSCETAGVSDDFRRGS